LRDHERLAGAAANSFTTQRSAAPSPLEHIIAVLKLMLVKGARGDAASEDMFLYEQLPTFETNIPALEQLFKSIIAVPGIETISNFAHTHGAGSKRPFDHRTTDSLVVPYSHLPIKTRPTRKNVWPIDHRARDWQSETFQHYMKGKAYPYKAHHGATSSFKGRRY